MKITVDRPDMLAGLKRVKPALASTPTAPALHSVHLAATENSLRLTATDLDLTIRHRLDATSPNETAAIIPARFLESVLGSMNERTAVIEVDDGTATVTCGEAVATTQVTPIEEWPLLDIDAGDLVDLDAATVQLFRSVVYAASEDRSRPALCGVRIEGHFAAATDSYRLAAADLGADMDLPGTTIPAAMLKSALAATDSGATMLVNQNSVSWSAGPTTWTTRTIQDAFPTWQRLIEQSVSTSHVTVNVLDLLDALKLMASVQLDESPTRLEWDGSWATVRRRGFDSEVVDRIAMDGDADMPSIAFSTSFLTDLLRSLPEDLVDVRIGAIDSLKPATVVLDRVTHLLMPIRASQ